MASFGSILGAGSVSCRTELKPWVRVLTWCQHTRLGELASKILRFALVIRESLLDPSKMLDVLIGAIAVAVGMFIVQGYMQIRYRYVSMQMSTMAPLWFWGASMMVKGSLSVLAAEMRWRAALVVSHMVGVSLWIFLWRFSGALVPTEMTYIAPVMAWACFARSMQIPRKGD